MPPPHTTSSKNRKHKESLHQINIEGNRRQLVINLPHHPMGDASFDQHGDGEDRMTLSLFSDSTQHPWRNFSNLGLLHRQMGQPELAVFWFEKALESEPNSHVVRVALAQTLEAMGRTGDAAYHLKHVAAAQGRDVQRWLLDSLKRLIPADHEEDPEEETLPKSRSSSSAISSSSASKVQLSKPASITRTGNAMRRMTMVDKIAAADETGMKVYNTEYKRELVQMVLSVEPDERTPDEINTLKRLTIAFNFFKNLPQDVHSELCKFMTFKTYHEYGVIIKEGDIGDCMYVILSGVVAVLHPQAAGKQRDISDPDFRDSQNRPLPAKNFALNSGIAFGEMALQQSMTRASFCCAETDVELIVVPKDAYTRLIKKFRDDETASRVDFLSSHVYLFDSWARDRINRIALHMQTKCYTPAQKCLLQGHEPEGLLFLFRGSVKVFRSPVTYMSKAEANLRQRMSNGGPFLTAVPDGEFAPSDGCSMPALHKLRTQAEKALWAASKLREKKSESGSLLNNVFNVASVKNLVDKKFIEGYTTLLTQLDAKLGAEVEVGAPVSESGIYVTELGPGSIIGAELSRYNRPGYRNARFPSQFSYEAKGFVDFLVLPKTLIINVNNQDDSIKKMDTYALEQLQQWSLAKESINRWSAYKVQLLCDIRRESKSKHPSQ